MWLWLPTSVIYRAEWQPEQGSGLQIWQVHSSSVLHFWFITVRFTSACSKTTNQGTSIAFFSEWSRQFVSSFSGWIRFGLQLVWGNNILICKEQNRCNSSTSEVVFGEENLTDLRILLIFSLCFRTALKCIISCLQFMTNSLRFCHWGNDQSSWTLFQTFSHTFPTLTLPTVQGLCSSLISLFLSSLQR